MNTSSKIILSTGLIFLLIGLSGCGSSSSGSGAVDTAVKITPDNGAEVASAAMTTVRLVGQFSQRLGSIVELFNQPGDNANFLQARAIVPPVPFPCRGSGTQTLSGEVEDPTFDSLTAGDTLTVEYNACEAGDGITLTGTLNLTIKELTGNLLAPPYSLTVDTASTDLSIAQDDETTSISGDATFIISTDNGVNIGNKVDIATLDYSEQVSGDYGTLSAFSATSDFDLSSSTPTYSQESSGTISSQDIDGSVDFATTTAFFGYLAGTESDNPVSGVMAVTGAADSSETITALDSVNVQLDIDENGDGTVDNTIPMTWDALFAL